MGRDTLNRSKNPTKVIIHINTVCDCKSVISVRKNLLHIMTAAAPSSTVMPPGTAFESTFGKNRPVTLSAFGSSASTTEGIPIVTAPIIVRFCGVKGRGSTTIINSNAKSVL